MIEKLIERLDGIKKTGHLSFVAKCPAHSDKSPSLAIREIEGERVLIHCFAGCNTHDVLNSIGLEFEDLFPPAHNGYKRESKPFPALQILKALAYESTIVKLAADDIAKGGRLSSVDAERVDLAYKRISAGADYGRL